MLARHRTKKRSRSSLPKLFSFAFLMSLSGAVLYDVIPVFVLIIYLFLSLITILLYFLDKRAAKKGAWRIKESNLQLLAALGGWPGAIIARHWFHHKTRKLSFRLVLWMAVLINISCLAGFLARKQLVF